jgi:hypothetical protein
LERLCEMILVIVFFLGKRVHSNAMTGSSICHMC